MRSIICPLGDERHLSVRKANIMVSRVVLLLYLLHAKGCVFIVEQPQGSLMPEHPRFAAFLLAVVVWKVVLIDAPV